MKKYRVLVTFSGWHTVYVDAECLIDATEHLEELLDEGELIPDETEYNQQELFSVEEVE
uniref:Uncharacterized protein n=1 Tax=viral metagenome TaxID=1070528 RepID=A0A6M3JGQ7_9ZZZZ